jgi:hypothetical protein
MKITTVLSAHVPVHPIHHGGVDLHAAGRESLLVGTHVGPLRFAVGDDRVRVDVGWAQPEPLERDQTRLAQRVRSGVIAATIFRDDVLGRLQWPVRRLEGQVREERSVLGVGVGVGVGGTFPEIPEQRVGVEVRRVEVFVDRHKLVVFGVKRERRQEVAGDGAIMAGSARQQRERPFESAGPRRPVDRVAEMPFAGHQRQVAGVAQ